LGTGRFFGEGKYKSPILMVTGVPEKERLGSDFLSPEERELLNSIIAKGLKMDPSEVFVTPIIKCRRQQDDFLPPQTQRICRNITLKEIKLAQPKAVVSFGIEAAQMLAKENLVLDRLRRRRDKVLDSGDSTAPLWMTIGLDSMLEYPILKKEAWEDLKKVIAFLEGA
jgi:uracil-DNA glycosylase family 4